MLNYLRCCMKRYVAALLSVVLFSCGLFSCSEKAGSADNPIYSDGYENADYGGADFTYLVIKHTETIADYYGGDFIDADTYTGKTVNDGVYERNLAVEEKYSIRVNELSRISSAPAEVLRGYFLSEDICFDVIYGWGYKLASCISEGYFKDIKSLSAIDLSKDYWCPSAVEDLSVKGGLYLFTSDISMNRLRWGNVLFYNETVADATGISKNGPTPVDMVISGGWTYDEYLKLVSDASWDLDENGKTDFDEYFGLVCTENDGYKAACASDIFYTKKTDTGFFAALGDERLLELINKVHSVYSDTNKVKTYDILIEDGRYSGDSDPIDYAVSYFTSNQALFCSSVGYLAEDIKENKSSEYAILPLPKLDREQEGYNTAVSSFASMFAVPARERNDIKGADFERTGRILEYTAHKSGEILLPAYMKDMLSESCDEREIEALALVRSGTRYEFSDLFGVSEVSTLLKAMFEKPDAASATYKRQEQKLNAKLAELYKSLESIEGAKADE